MSEQYSFQRAVYEGIINGPDWPVVNVDTGEEVSPGGQDFGHMEEGRAVKSKKTGSFIGHSIIDFQHPADTPVELQDPGIGYAGQAQDPYFRDA